MTVNIVIGRDGRVKEAQTYSPVENAIEDAALTAVRKWTFQPQNVDGVPAQISTSLALLFPADYQKLDASQPQVRPMFDRMRTTGDLRLDGAPAFHMKASFHSEDGSAKGTYEETWVSPKKWRREVSLNDTTVVEVQTEKSPKFWPGSPEVLHVTEPYLSPEACRLTHPSQSWLPVCERRAGLAAHFGPSSGTRPSS